MKPNPFAWALLSMIGCSQPLPPAVDPEAPPPPETLTFVTSPWPPYTGAPGSPRVALDLVADALGRAGYRAEFEVFEVFADAETELTRDTRDGGAALWRSEARERKLLFSDAYLVNRLVLVGPAGADVTAESLAGLAGRSVGVVRGYAYGNARSDAGDVTFVEHDTTDDILRALVDGQVDYVLVDELLIHHLMALQPEASAEKIAVGTRALIERTLHLAVRRSRPDASTIVERFNEQVRTLITDGSYHAALGVHWIRADIDGDGDQELALAGVSAGEEPPQWAYSLPNPEGEAAPDAQARVEFFVDGKNYETWDQIPPEYRVPSDPTVGQPGGAAGLIRFRF